MLDKVISIELVFENCEMMTFEQDDIVDLELGNITTNILKVAVNGIVKKVYANEVYIELKKESNSKFVSFGDEGYKFDRILRYNDIVLMDLHFEDGRIETYHVCYNGEEINSNQNVVLKDNGNLVIDIKDKENKEVK